MRREIQIKTRKLLSAEELISLGAEWIGNVESENIYLKSYNVDYTERVRIEGNVHHFTKKSRDLGKVARVKEIEEVELSAHKAKCLIKARGVDERFEISSRMFAFNGGIISLDEVTGIGCFLEVSAVENEEELLKILKFLGIKQEDCLKESYYDLVKNTDIPRWKRPIFRMHRKIAEMTYGFTSGIMTTSGMLIGTYFAVPSKAVVAGGMMALAVSDSFSEAYSMYNAKIAEGMSHINALRHALYTMNGNIVIPTIFLVPIFALPLHTAIVVNLSLSTSLLILISVLNSLATCKNVFRKVSKDLTLAVLIVVLSTIGGKIVAKIFS